MKQTKLTAGGWDRRKFPPFKNQLPDPDGSYNEWLETLCIKPVSAIEWHLDPFFRQGPRVTTDVNWMWIMKGRGEVILGEDERVIKVKAGDSVFIRPTTRHIEYFPSRLGWSSISMHFFAYLFGSIDFLALTGFPVFFRERPSEGLGETAKRLAREFALKPPGWNSAMAADIRLALLRVVRHGAFEFQPASQQNLRRDAPRLFPLIKMIDERISDPSLSVPDLARKAGLSGTRFRAIFKRFTGLSPVSYIHRRRIEQACILLRQTDQSIKQIGVDCGFADEPFFYRVFHRLTDTTPKNYRENKIM
jgi:AraC-like DNA-binding protein